MHLATFLLRAAKWHVLVDDGHLPDACTHGKRARARVCVCLRSCVAEFAARAADPADAGADATADALADSAADAAADACAADAGAYTATNAGTFARANAV
jgi:hypothetical protein